MVVSTGVADSDAASVSCVEQAVKANAVVARIPATRARCEVAFRVVEPGRVVACVWTGVRREVFIGARLVAVRAVFITK